MFTCVSIIRKQKISSCCNHVIITHQIKRSQRITIYCICICYANWRLSIVIARCRNGAPVFWCCKRDKFEITVVVLGFNAMLTLSQTTNSRLFQTERFCSRQFQIWWKWQKVLQTGRKHYGKRKKLLMMSNFSFSHSVLKRLVLQTGKNQSFFGKGF